MYTTEDAKKMLYWDKKYVIPFECLDRKYDCPKDYMDISKIDKYMLKAHTIKQGRTMNYIGYEIGGKWVSDKYTEGIEYGLLFSRYKQISDYLDRHTYYECKSYFEDNYLKFKGIVKGMNNLGFCFRISDQSTLRLMSNNCTTKQMMKDLSTIYNSINLIGFSLEEAVALQSLSSVPVYVKYDKITCEGMEIDPNIRIERKDFSTGYVVAYARTRHLFELLFENWYNICVV